MMSLDDLCAQGRMIWIQDEGGWSAAPDDIVGALSHAGFEECKRATTTSRRDLRPAGGVWQGVNRSTGSVASAIWVNRPRQTRSIVFIAIDGEAFRDRSGDGLAADSYKDDGGEA
jgi:hypothetical protein